MVQDTLDFGNMAEFDALAQSIAAKLQCENSLISVVREDALVALGHSDISMDPAARSLSARNTICARTVQANKPLRIADVNSQVDIRGLPAVQAMNIGAYLGVPLRVNGGPAVGAICALSTSARIWNDGELAYLNAVADLAESKIERHLLRYEQEALSAALAENDAILNTLSQMHGKALTIHNAEGELVFANSAMHSDLHLSNQEMLALPSMARQLHRAGAMAGSVHVVLPVPTQTALYVSVSAAENGMILAEWSRVPIG